MWLKPEHLILIDPSAKADGKLMLQQGHYAPHPSVTRVSTILQSPKKRAEIIGNQHCLFAINHRRKRDSTFTEFIAFTLAYIRKF
jgi:hypothetical protein